MTINDDQQNKCPICCNGNIAPVRHERFQGTRFIAHNGKNFSYELKVSECDTCTYRNNEIINWKEETTRK